MLRFSLNCTVPFDLSTTSKFQLYSLFPSLAMSYLSACLDANVYTLPSPLDNFLSSDIFPIPSP